MGGEQSTILVILPYFGADTINTAQCPCMQQSTDAGVGASLHRGLLRREGREREIVRDLVRRRKNKNTTRGQSGLL